MAWLVPWAMPIPVTQVLTHHPFPIFISGTIPVEIAKMSSLRILQLNDNKLTGTIPTGKVDEGFPIAEFAFVRLVNFISQSSPLLLKIVTSRVWSYGTISRAVAFEER
jgi:hypothetical protein